MTLKFHEYCLNTSTLLLFSIPGCPVDKGLLTDNLGNEDKGMLLKK